MRAWPNPLQALAEARGMLFPWVPVCMALGIGLWFGLRDEPGLGVYAAALAVFLAMVALRLQGAEGWHPLAIALACVAFGVLAAGMRGHLQAAPVLGFRYYGPVEGRIIEVDRSSSDHIRITLDRVVLERLPPDRTPATVRLSLHGPPEFVPVPGPTVILTGHLAPPQPPPEPGGLDFQRIAYFERLGAVGYTRTPVLLLEPPEPGQQAINRLRAHLSAAITARIGGQAGAFAAGAVTGDRSGITEATVADLRDSNLAHLLAISGMNLAFLTGFVFAALRYGVALVPAVALRVNAKKLAALVALAVAGFYLLLSGGNLATERAFLMAAVMLGAVLVDRRALSLRTVALSACVLLIWQPESLLHAGFQMSFAATVVLIAGFGALEGQVLRERLPRWTMPLFTLVLSSVLAGAATAPFAAAHFNRFTDYGLLANLLTVPAMGLCVMPGAVVATLLAPLGLAAPGLWLMELGSRWVLLVAAWVAGWEGAVTGIATPGPWVLPLMTLGVLWAVIWRGRLRLPGLAPVAVALLLWSQTERAPVLISADGAQVGLIGPEGRALSSPRGAGFSAQSWLENDGDLAQPATAAARPGFSGPQGARSFHIGGVEAVHLKGKSAPQALAGACATAGLVILAAKADVVPDGCRVIDQTLLTTTGGMALWPGKDGTLRLEPARQGQRLWSRHPKRDAPQQQVARAE